METGTGEPKAPPAEAPPACALPCAARGQMWIEHSAIRPNPGGPWRARVLMHRHALTCLGRDGPDFKRQEKTLECLLGEPPACVHVFCELNIFRKAIPPHCQVPRGSTGATPLLRLHLVSTPLALGFSCAESLATQRAPHPAQGLRLISAQHARLGSSALPVSAEAQCPSPPFPSLREPPLLPPPSLPLPFPSLLRPASAPVSAGCVSAETSADPSRLPVSLQITSAPPRAHLGSKC